MRIIIQDVKNSFAGKPQVPLFTISMIKKPERLPERRLHRFHSELRRICLLYNELDLQVKQRGPHDMLLKEKKKTYNAAKQFLQSHSTRRQSMWHGGRKTEEEEEEERVDGMAEILWLKLTTAQYKAHWVAVSSLILHFLISHQSTRGFHFVHIKLDVSQVISLFWGGGENNGALLRVAHPHSSQVCTWGYSLEGVALAGVEHWGGPHPFTLKALTLTKYCTPCIWRSTRLPNYHHALSLSSVQRDCIIPSSASAQRRMTGGAINTGCVYV